MTQLKGGLGRLFQRSACGVYKATTCFLLRFPEKRSCELDLRQNIALQRLA
jgi:hypothetical protein